MATMLARSALSVVRSRASVTTTARALSNAAGVQFNAGVSPAVMMMINPASVPTPMINDPFVRKPLVFETPNMNLHISHLPEVSNSVMECPTNVVNEPLLAVKRTYQPSVLRRKRKHGFMSRRRTVSGRKLLTRRFIKGRWRMSL